MSRRILIVEDDHDFARLIRIHLEDEGWEVEVAEDGVAGLRRIQKGGLDLVILDLMLPGLDGYEITRRVRSENPRMPLLMLTARSEEVDRVLGLEMGADDYLSKPVSTRELVARVKAVFRRQDAYAEPRDHQGRIQYGDLVLEVDKREVRIGGQPVSLTAKEFDLLHFFARNPGRVYTRRELLDAVWGYGFEGYEHTVNSHINRLRAKIELRPSQPEWILTVRGVGYRFRETT